MALSVNESFFEAAPGNVIIFTGSGLANSTASLTEQGALADGTTALVRTDNPSNDTSASYLIPDGATNGLVHLVGSGGPPDVVDTPIQLCSQYLMAEQFVGQGIDTSDLAAGELDATLRAASQYCDTFIGEPEGVRLVQTVEQHAWKSDESERGRRVYPLRHNVLTIDSFVVQISNLQFATFPGTDIVINVTQNYIEILSYAIASYTLLGDIQNLGLVANIIKLIYTAGWDRFHYPRALVEATKIIATELLTMRRIQAQGFGGFASVKQGNQAYDRRSEAFDIPLPAQRLLRSFAFGALR